MPEGCQTHHGKPPLRRAQHTVGGRLLSFPASFKTLQDTMELNPIRQRIADLKGRLDSLRGYL